MVLRFLSEAKKKFMLTLNPDANECTCMIRELLQMLIYRTHKRNVEVNDPTQCMWVEQEYISKLSVRADFCSH